MVRFPDIQVAQVAAVVGVARAVHQLKLRMVVVLDTVTLAATVEQIIIPAVAAVELEQLQQIARLMRQQLAVQD